MKHVLIIEDEATIVLLLRLRLEAAGFKPSWAMNGEDGLRRVLEEKPDLVLLDLRLPRLNGFDVCRRIKQDPATAHIPVIFLSASEKEELEETCIATGADGYLTKPYEAAELLGKIKSLLGDPLTLH